MAIWMRVIACLFSPIASRRLSLASPGRGMEELWGGGADRDVATSSAAGESGGRGGGGGEKLISRFNYNSKLDGPT